MHSVRLRSRSRKSLVVASGPLTVVSFDWLTLVSFDCSTLVSLDIATAPDAASTGAIGETVRVSGTIIAPINRLRTDMGRGFIDASTHPSCHAANFPG